MKLKLNEHPTGFGLWLLTSTPDILILQTHPLAQDLEALSADLAKMEAVAGAKRFHYTGVHGWDSFRRLRQRRTEGQFLLASCYY